MLKYITIPEEDYLRIESLAKTANCNELKIILSHQTERCAFNGESITFPVAWFDFKKIDDIQFNVCLSQIEDHFKGNDQLIGRCSEILDKARKLHDQTTRLDHEIYLRVYKIPFFIRWIFGIKYIN